MRKILIAAIATATLGGCAIDNSAMMAQRQANQLAFEKDVGSFVGKTESELISTNGIPTSTYATGETKFIKYEQAERRMVHAGLPPEYYNGVMVNPARPAIYNTFSCEVLYEVKKDKVVNWKYKGNSCY